MPVAVPNWFFQSAEPGFSMTLIQLGQNYKSCRTTHYDIAVSTNATTAGSITQYR